MAINWNTTGTTMASISNINFDGNNVNMVTLDGTTVWCKPLTFTVTNSSMLTYVISRNATSEPSASTGTGTIISSRSTSSSTGTAYYGDTVFISVTRPTNRPTITITVSGTYNSSSKSSGVGYEQLTLTGVKTLTGIMITKT